MNNDHLLGFQHVAQHIDMAEHLSAWSLNPATSWRHVYFGGVEPNDYCHYPCGVPTRVLAEFDRACEGALAKDGKRLLASLPGEPPRIKDTHCMTKADIDGTYAQARVHSLLRLAGEQLSLRGHGALSLKA